MFALIAGIILATVVLLLAFPFIRQTDAPEVFEFAPAEDQERIDLEIEKESLLNSLSELEDDKAQGRIQEKDYPKLKATDEFRLAQVLRRLDEITEKDRRPVSGKKRPSPQTAPALSWVSVIVLTVGVLATSSGIYSYMAMKEKEQRLAAERVAQSPPSQGMPNPVEMVARLEKRLKENPNDLQGQIMAGRSYLALERWEDAKSAWKKVLEMEPSHHEAHYNLAVILINEAEPGNLKNYEKALDHLNQALVKVPREPAVLWYKGIALVHLQRFSEADESWTTAYQNLPPGSPDSELVKQALQNLRENTAPQF